MRDPRHLVVSDESARYTVASEPSGGNRYWVQCLYGPPLFRVVGARGGERCSGATVGGRDAMRAYLETMASELAAPLPPESDRVDGMPRSIPFTHRGMASTRAVHEKRRSIVTRERVSLLSRV